MKTTTPLPGWRSMRQFFPALLLLLLPLLVRGQSANIVISQVYGAGGNAGATYNQDFVELFNRSSSPVTISGWTIQYATSTGNFGGSGNTYTLTNVTIPGGRYYLVGIGAVGSNGTGIGSDQAATTGGLSASAGKVVLSNNANTVTYTAPNSFSSNVVDVVGYTVSSGNTGTNMVNAYEGAAPAAYPSSAASAVSRIGNVPNNTTGCIDTNSNGADFATTAVNPRNSSAPPSSCSNPVLVANPATLSFSAPAGQAATVATYTLSGFNLVANAPIAISSMNAAVQVSTTGVPGSFANMLNLNVAADGTLMQTVTVRYTAPTTIGITNSTISNSDGTRTASVAVTGTSVMAYAWNGTSTSYSNATSWTPTRTTPGSSDILVFDGNTISSPTVVLDYVAAQTVGQLLFSNNIAATLSTNGDRTLTVDNNLPGDDFAIGAGSTVTVVNNTTAASSGLDILLTSNETAVISGTLIFAGNTSTNNGRHTLQSTSTGTGAIQFLDGSLFRATDTYSTVSPFGANTVNNGTVIFRNGSRCEQLGGSTPFGATGMVVTTFEPSSYFLFGASSSSPSLTNRTYGILAYTNNSTATINGPTTIQGDLLVLNGNVTLNLTGTIALQGNLQVNTAASLNFGANSSNTVVQMNGITSQTIGSTGATTAPVFGLNTALAINNAAGVTLAVPIIIPGTLQLTSGLLTTTTASSLTLAANAMGGSNTSFVNGPVLRPVSTAGTYTFPIGKSVSYRPLTLTVSAQSGTAYYRAEQVEGNPGQNVGSSGLTRVSIFRSFTITPFASAADAATGIVTQPSNFTGTVTLSFGSNDGVTDPAATTFVVGKRADSSQPWANIGRSGNTGSTLTSGSFMTFSDFVLASTDPNPTPNPLPVVLTSFTATRQTSGAVQVGWATASEQHSAYFEVQRSFNGGTFATIAKVAANGTTTQAHLYTSLDQSAPATQLYYRLRQVDTDGTESFSPVVTLGATEAAATLALYPNPAHSRLTIAAAAGQEVQVIDLAGRVLQTTTLPASGNLSIESLPAGTYLLRAPFSGQQRVLRFTKE